MDKDRKAREDRVRNQIIQEDAKVQGMPNVNIPVTENIKLVWTHQDRRRRQPLRKMMDKVVPGKRRRGPA